MYGRRRMFFVFIIFFLLSLLIFFSSQKGWTNGITESLQAITLPVQQFSFRFFNNFSNKDENSELTKLKNENRNLQNQLVRLNALEKDNQALRDQFVMTNPSSATLLPAFIVGMPAFLPGTSIVDEIIIDKGSNDKVRVGNSIVFKDNLIGKIVKVSPRLSVVNLINHKDVSFTAKTSVISALGIIQGNGTEIIVFKNVLLSDILQEGDIVVTKGDINADGVGFPPGLIVGKIISVKKKASALFQSAEVERLIDVTKLEMVFVVLGDRE